MRAVGPVRDIGKSAVVPAATLQRERKRLLMRWQDDVVGYEKAHGGAENGVSREMILRRDSRETDGSGQTVCHERDPAMVSITMRDHRRHGHGQCCMTRIKPAGVEWVVRTVEEAIDVRSTSGIRERLSACSCQFEGYIQQVDVRSGFGCQQRRVLRVGIFA